MKVTDISNVSANISYSTFQGCDYFPTDIEVQLVLVNVNTNYTVPVDSKSYIANRTDSFNLSSLNASTLYNFTVQVFDSDSTKVVGLGETGTFMTGTLMIILVRR